MKKENQNLAEIELLKKQNAELKRDLALGLVGQGMITANMNVKNTCEAIARDVVEKVRCDSVRIFRIVGMDGERKIVGSVGADKHGKLFEIKDYPPKIEIQTGRISPLVVLGVKIMHLKNENSKMHLYELTITSSGQIRRKEKKVQKQIMSKIIENAKGSGVWEKVELPVFEKRVDDFGNEINEVIAVIVADNAMSKIPISDSKILVLGKAAQFAGIQLVNAMFYERLEKESITDSLTGIFNRRHLNERLRNEIMRSMRYAHPLSMIVADIDFFKHINDKYGHAEGDAVLKIIAEKLKSVTRNDIDVIARYGGEEFVILFPETELEKVEKISENIRKTIAEHHFKLFKDGKSIKVHVTISIGAADLSSVIKSITKKADRQAREIYRTCKSYLFDKGQPDRGFMKCCDELSSVFFKAADKALYAAKHAGRNRVKVFG